MKFESAPLLEKGMEINPPSLPRKLVLTTPPTIVAVAAALSVFGIGSGLIFYPILLLTALGVLLLGISLSIAWVSAKSFLQTGSINILFLGIAVLEFGSAATLGGIVSSVSIAAGNFVYLTGVTVAGALHFTSASLTLHGSPQRNSGRRSALAIPYIIVLLSVVAVSILAIESSATVSSITTQLLDGLTAGLFLASAILFSRIYSRSHNSTIYWYSLGLATTGFGFVALLFPQTAGSLGTWTAIGGVLLGGLYFLISVVATPKP